MGEEASIITLIYESTDFKLKLIRRDKEGHFILTKGTANQDNITILYMHVSNSEVPNFIKNLLLGLETQLNIH